MISRVMTDIQIYILTPTHMKRRSFRPDVVKYVMAALKPEIVYISYYARMCTTFFRVVTRFIII